MTDAELIARLRALGRDFDDWDTAADRIEALTAERDELAAAKWNKQHADTMNDIVLMGLARDAATARAEKAEAKLAKAVEELERQVEAWSNALEFNILATQHRTSASILLDGVRATLAEIEGSDAP
jgi:hypothetical protein